MPLYDVIMPTYDDTPGKWQAHVVAVVTLVQITLLRLGLRRSAEMPEAGSGPYATR
jgi:hypothetical protein